jgi:hypothetical protein
MCRAQASSAVRFSALQSWRLVDADHVRARAGDVIEHGFREKQLFVPQDAILDRAEAVDELRPFFGEKLISGLQQSLEIFDSLVRGGRPRGRAPHPTAVESQEPEAKRPSGSTHSALTPSQCPSSSVA